MAKSNDPVEKSDQLDKKLEAMPNLEQQIGVLSEAGKKTRKLVLLLAVSVGINVALTILLGAFFYNQNVIQNKQIKLQNNQLTSCNSGNEFRKSEIKLWNYILTSSPPPQTDEQQQRLDTFKGVLSDAFKLRDCNKLK